LKVIGLDGREHNWKLTGRSLSGNDTRPRSQYHKRARALLLKLFPFDQRLEEVPLPGSGKLTADFFLPARRLLIEVHGEQHYGYTDFFHKDAPGFMRSQQRDSKKSRWCETNNINFVELPYGESDEQWTTRINDALGGNQTDE